MDNERNRTVSGEDLYLPMSLLKNKTMGVSSNNESYLRESIQRIQDVLSSSGVDAHIVNVFAGPISFRYELELSRGVRLAEIQYCASDIALALGCEKVTIAPVVGKYSVVGFDVPKRSADTVCLRRLLDTREFIENSSPLAFGLGIGTTANNIFCDLNVERHLLIGGTTGSGKSTLLHSMIVSMLYHASQDDVRFVIVDTKGLELTPYNGIPQMLIPVVTDERKAAGTLQWLNTELLHRYKTISDAGVTSLDAFNHLATGVREKLPHIVVIIDDVFHLFSLPNDPIEDVLRNLILRGHVVGIHLVLSTQHAYTGSIVKIANLRNMGRIAFALPGRYDSIALLGKDGAERLSGKGEMLYLPIGSSTPQRVQGCFISDSEVYAIANYVTENFSFQDNQSVMSDIENHARQTRTISAVRMEIPNSIEPKSDRDELLPAAVDVLLETGTVSVSILQRRLKLGYARASRIVDEMEEMGIVGPFQGSKPRCILITREKWEKMKNS